MPLTTEQLHEIRRIVRDHHTAFIINTMGPDAVPQDVVDDLKAKGLVNVQVNSIEDAYLYGQVMAATQDPKVAKMSYDEFKDYLRKNPVVLSDVEKRAVQFSRHQAAQYVHGLGNRVDQHTGQLLIEADAKLRAQTRDTIQDATTANAVRRDALKKLRKDLGWATKDWTRDWDRIAVTEKQHAFQRGAADQIADEFGDDALVAKRVAPDACKHCIRLYIGPDGMPRIFKMSTLENNGTNYGRKAQDWRPTVGPIHPSCQCNLIRIPDGWGFNEDGQVVPDGEYGIHYKNLADFQRARTEELDLRKSMVIDHRVQFQGLTIAVENVVGAKRYWHDEHGERRHTVMRHAYGYIERTEGADGEEVDCFLGPNPQAPEAYVVHQQNPRTGTYDEDKVMLGFSSEAEARWAYLQNYDRPDFLVTVSAMPMDDFKRWVRFTIEPDAQMFKAGKPVERFTLPLAKGDMGVAPYAGAITSPAGDRAPSALGTGVNYVMHEPVPKPAPKVDGIKPKPKEWVESVADDRERQRLDVEELFVSDGGMDHAGNWKIADKDYAGNTLDSDEVQRRKADVLATTFHGRGDPELTHAEVGDDVAKAAYVTPIGGVTPGGYKKVGPKEYVKLVPQQQSSVHKGDTKRIGEFKPAKPAELTPPEVYHGFLQHGHQAVYTSPTSGKSRTGTLMGYNHEGRPVIKFPDGKQRTYHWKDVKTADSDQPYRPVYDGLGKEKLFHASARQKRLVHDVMGLKIGDHAAKDYTDWLRNRGNEVFLVGGIVRDLVTGTTPGQTLSDAELKDAMKDIDIVSTAHPGVGKQLADHFLPPHQKNDPSVVRDNSGWGVVQILAGVGIDIASISSDAGDNFAWGKHVYDHDLEEDANRRDFTANALSYDVYNDTIVDPTGHGIADAQAKVLRLAPTPAKARQNRSLPMRFWKFRARGWRGEAKTLALMKEMLPKMDATHIAKELGKILNKGGSAKAKAKTWKKLKQAMHDDGAGDLWLKHIYPHRKQFGALIGKAD